MSDLESLIAIIKEKEQEIKRLGLELKELRKRRQELEKESGKKEGKKKPGPKRYSSAAFNWLVDIFIYKETNLLTINQIRKLAEEHGIEELIKPSNHIHAVMAKYPEVFVFRGKGLWEFLGFDDDLEI